MDINYDKNKKTITTSLISIPKYVHIRLCLFTGAVHRLISFIFVCLSGRKVNKCVK